MKCLKLFACGLSLLLNAATASAEDPSHDEMVCALNPQCASPFNDRRLRGISATPSTRPPLSFDITLNFPFDSAELTPDSREKLDRVAKALTDSNTDKFDIIISGHTDGKGTADYNLALSERRAEAVRRYLITQHAISASRLVAKGYGKSQLLLPSDPNNEMNRRVQFQNPNTKPASASVAAPTPAAASSKVATPPKVAAPVADGDGL